MMILTALTPEASSAFNIGKLGEHGHL